ncbi:MAG: PAS domain S-box protein, partial [Planctomycetes bacterium]|nr:PAS domain S-box protein [Planctomycetota bacterium]
MTTFNANEWSKCNNHLLFKIIEEDSDAILITDAKSGDILFANQQACTNLRYTLQEMQNLTVMDIQSVLPDEFSYQRHLEMLKSHNKIIVEGAHKRKDGSTFPVEV